MIAAYQLIPEEYIIAVVIVHKIHVPTVSRAETLAKGNSRKGEDGEKKEIQSERSEFNTNER